AATLLLLGELQAGAGRYRDAERAYRAAAKDSLVGPLAIYRRARVLVRLGDPGADEALAAFAQTYPADTAAPTALYLIGDMRGERGGPGWPATPRSATTDCGRAARPGSRCSRSRAPRGRPYRAVWSRRSGASTRWCWQASTRRPRPKCAACSAAPRRSWKRCSSG